MPHAIDYRSFSDVQSITIPLWEPLPPDEGSYASHGGFSQISNRVIDLLLPQMDGSSVKVYIALCRGADPRKQMSVTIGYADLCRATNVSKRQVQRALQSLVDFGCVQVLHKGDFLSPHTYRLLVPTNANGIVRGLSGVDVDVHSGQGCRVGVDVDVHRGVDMGVHPTRCKNGGKNLKRSSKKEDAATFLDSFSEEPKSKELCIPAPTPTADPTLLAMSSLGIDPAAAARLWEQNPSRCREVAENLISRGKGAESGGLAVDLIRHPTKSLTAPRPQPKPKPPSCPLKAYIANPELYEHAWEVVLARYAEVHPLTGELVNPDAHARLLRVRAGAEPMTLKLAATLRAEL